MFAALSHDLLRHFATLTSCCHTRYEGYSKSHCFSISRCVCILIEQGTFPYNRDPESRPVNKVLQTFWLFDFEWVYKYDHIIFFKKNINIYNLNQ